jgi:tRNA G18 (ribose-2'-O)-methylase SpoU
MGSIFRLPAFHGGTLQDLVRRLGDERCQLVAAETGTGREPETIDWNRPSALFLGPERGTVPEEVRSLMDTGVTIPMEPEVDSLSVGAAAAVILFAARRIRSRGRQNPGASRDG